MGGRRLERYPSVAGRPRAEFLAELVSLRRSIVVAGAHGKTTTAGMIAFVLAELGLDPAWLVGGEIAQLGGNAGAGEGWLVVEGDESDRTVERLRPEIAVVTNVELDHHATFARRPRCEACSSAGSRDVPQVVRGWELEPASFRAGGARRAQPAQRRRGARRARARGRRTRRTRSRCSRASAVPGGASSSSGEAGGVTVVDDYAHHPTEIAATIAAARERTSGRVIVLFQPHLYSRTRHLAHELGAALVGRRRGVRHRDLRGARGAAAGVDGKLVVERSRPGTRAGWAPRVEDGAELVAAWARPGDLVADRRRRRRRASRAARAGGAARDARGGRRARPR